MFSLLFVALTGSRALLKSLSFCPIRRLRHRLCPREEPTELSSVENMGRVHEKIGEEEKHRKADPVAPPSDVSDFTVIREGEAEILIHPGNEVFYNKTQVNNRDMSIAVLRTFISKRKQEHEAMLARRKANGPKVADEPAVEQEADVESARSNGKLNGECEVSDEIFQDEPCSVSDDKQERKGPKELKPPLVLEALSASGLRSIRYAREVDGIGQVVALDNNKACVEACRRNIKFNGSMACSKVESQLADARVYMLTHPKEFDVVDLDPYGTPSIFLDSAVQSVVDGGMLMCTATDMAVLCGANGEVCYSKYGAYPLKGKYCHEMALRIVLACIESHANRYRRYIVPVLSVKMDFYVRVFVRIYTSASAMKNTPLKLSYVYQCTGCDSFHLQPLGRTVSKNRSIRYLPGFGPVVAQECSHCGKKYNMGGPIWSAPIHDMEWVTSILEDVESMKDRYPAFGRISAVLTTISEELPDVPLFLSLHNLCATLKCTSPSAVIFRSAVINAGYRISGTHINPLGLKTDAPMDVIWDIMRCWVKNHPVRPQPPDQAGCVILAKEPVLQANFARAVASLSKAQAKKVARYLPNPERHWGPKVRAGRRITSKHASLLGPEAVNVVNGHGEGDEPPSKRNKTQEDPSPST
ncbi:UNVERIFIED_CONTAM: putative tRNA (guanine(26)-N(2))-dimethyltransferase 2 [Sesamum radiatum]|uniref:tRNA (guanine(26)-N(2))-dimethyltransferase n=1 Tax=Sesamum radiatum TaxID=300843 RepID=A0AAW2VRZ4_SESRA